MFWIFFFLIEFAFRFHLLTFYFILSLCQISSLFFLLQFFCVESFFIEIFFFNFISRYFFIGILLINNLASWFFWVCFRVRIIFYLIYVLSLLFYYIIKWTVLIGSSLVNGPSIRFSLFFFKYYHHMSIILFK